MSSLENTCFHHLFGRQTRFIAGPNQWEKLALLCVPLCNFVAKISTEGLEGFVNRGIKTCRSFTKTDIKSKLNFLGFAK
jgi:hypothetical protein